MSIRPLNQGIGDYEMSVLVEQKVLVQRHWTRHELTSNGFLFYRPVKQITMARKLQRSEVPKTMKTSGNTITAQVGYWIAYTAGDALKETLDDYKARPLEPHIFAETYRPWNEPFWQPTPTEAHLHRLGCQPYYKTAGVWAKQLVDDTWVQGIESAEPTLSPKGDWLCVGMEGEPWSITPAWFQAHYLLPGDEDPNRN